VRRSPKDVYLRFIEFEEKAAAIYLRLASHFSSRNRKLSALWLDMAIEEKQHAGLLQFCVQERMFSQELPSDDEIRKFTTLFRKLEKRAADQSLDPSGAFGIAAELEGSEVNAIYSYMTTPLHASTYLLKRKIVTSPIRHIDHLVTAGKSFKISGPILKKLESLKEACPKSWG
jgi:rubrerythrin